ncbi:unnamed protein product [Ectocarpus fasciculatus]
MPVGFVNGGGGNSPEELFRSIPPVSKVLIVGMVGTMFSIVLGVCSPYEYALSWPLVWNKFHLWRLFTSGIFPGEPGYGALMSMFSIGMFSMRYEKDGFSMGGGGGSADYAYMLLFGFVCIEASLLLLFYQPFMIFTEAIMFYICYVWSRKNPGKSVSFWGILVNALYVPWVMIAMRVVLGSSIFMALLGIAVGHLFYFLVDVLPDLHDIDVLQTPQFLVNMLGWGREGSGVSMQAGDGGGAAAGARAGAAGMPAPGAVRPPRDFPRAGGGSGWGTGRTLGSS